MPGRIVVDVPTRHLDPDLWSIDTREKSVATLMDLGSVHKLAGDETSGAGQFIFSTWARAQARERGGGRVGPELTSRKKLTSGDK